MTEDELLVYLNAWFSQYCDCNNLTAGTLDAYHQIRVAISLMQGGDMWAPSDKK